MLEVTEEGCPDPNPGNRSQEELGGSRPVTGNCFPSKDTHQQRSFFSSCSPLWRTLQEQTQGNNIRQ